jgi:hypothetical protein
MRQSFVAYNYGTNDRGFHTGITNPHKSTTHRRTGQADDMGMGEFPKALL